MFLQASGDICRLEEYWRSRRLSINLVIGSSVYLIDRAGLCLRQDVVYTVDKLQRAKTK